jgi:predicted AlkP superfamily pyrophosphatase or phosphodiesterase
MRRILALRSLPLVLISLALALSGCLHPAQPTQPAPVILISMDGFRWDYTTLHPDETPHIRQLARDGVTARGLVPVFPSNTFPNHYAIATGLYPSHSGMVNNHMFDRTLGEFFHYNRPASSHDNRWWGGEPIWITAVKQGRPSACSFWPGSEAEIKGVHATFWKPYNYAIPFAERLNELVRWLKLPPEQRPVVVTFYLEETNSTGHNFGPDSPELAATLKLMDGRIGEMMTRLGAEGVAANFVLVSDHGMTTCGPDRILVLDDYLDLKTVQVDFDETVCGLRPAPGHGVDEIVAALSSVPHARVYRAENLPERLHVDPSNPRVPPIWVLPDEGWQMLRRAAYERYSRTLAPGTTTPDKAQWAFLKGQHGYDPADESMHGIFIASGPAFQRGVILPEVANIHVYNLLCAVAGLKPAPNDGDDRLVKAALRKAP